MLDIGAHVGSFAALFCKLCDHNVVAFEPVPQSQALIKQTAALNQVQAGRIKVIGKALGKAPGVIEMHLDQATGFAQIQPIQGQSRTLISIDATTTNIVRGTMETRISLLKIDVEGYEAEVLQGTSNTLCQDRPVLLLEIHNACLAERGLDQKRMLNGVVEQDYSLMRLNGREITASAASGAFLPRSHLLAVPKEKRHYYQSLLTGPG